MKRQELITTQTGTARSVLVTGASSGIGRATSLALAEAGWRVFAGVRSRDSAPQVQGVTPLVIDVADPESVRAALESVAEDLDGRSLDALVNNAGIGQLAPMQSVTAHELRSVFDVNVFGAVEVTQRALRLMSSGSRLVFIGSVGDRITMPFGGPLTSSKWAVASIAEAFRLELAGAGIRVVLVEPGSIHTDAVQKVEDAARVTAARIAQHDPELSRRFELAARIAVANERGGSKPEVVAATVTRALNASRPRTRYLTGQHAHLLAMLGRLPDRVFDRFRLRLFGQTARAAR